VSKSTSSNSKISTKEEHQEPRLTTQLATKHQVKGVYLTCFEIKVETTQARKSRATINLNIRSKEGLTTRLLKTDQPLALSKQEIKLRNCKITSSFNHRHHVKALRTYIMKEIKDSSISSRGT
jgi:hypothetical protein